jgi:hypothetical protein
MEVCPESLESPKSLGKFPETLDLARRSGNRIATKIGATGFVLVVHPLGPLLCLLA